MRGPPREPTRLDGNRAAKRVTPPSCARCLGLGGSRVREARVLCSPRTRHSQGAHDHAGWEDGPRWARPGGRGDVSPCRVMSCHVPTAPHPQSQIQAGKGFGAFAQRTWNDHAGVALRSIVMFEGRVLSQTREGLRYPAPKRPPKSQATGRKTRCRSLGRRLVGSPLHGAGTCVVFLKLQRPGFQAHLPPGLVLRHSGLCS